MLFAPCSQYTPEAAPDVAFGLDFARAGETAAINRINASAIECLGVMESPENEQVLWLRHHISRWLDGLQPLIDQVVVLHFPHSSKEFAVKVLAVSLILAVSCAATCPALAKNAYLIIGGGENATVYGFKSEAQCEKAKAQYAVWLKQTRAKINANPFLKKAMSHLYETDGNPRCKNMPPVGYVRAN